jgi:ferredoxin, 2Fe-2S
MTHITFVLPSGERKEVNATDGASLMRAAVDNSVAGIAAECGGCLSCATCHVYVDTDWVTRIPPPNEDEKVMVECAIAVQPNSRLSCQITVTAELDGMVVNVPAGQY